MVEVLFRNNDGWSKLFGTEGMGISFEDHDSFSNLLVRRKVTKDELDKTVKGKILSLKLLRLNYNLPYLKRMLILITNNSLTISLEICLV